MPVERRVACVGVSVVVGRQRHEASATRQTASSDETEKRARARANERNGFMIMEETQKTLDESWGSLMPLYG